MTTNYVAFRKNASISKNLADFGRTFIRYRSHIHTVSGRTFIRYLGLLLPKFSTGEVQKFFPGFFTLPRDLGQRELRGIYKVGISFHAPWYGNRDQLDVSPLPYLHPHRGWGRQPASPVAKIQNRGQNPPARRNESVASRWASPVKSCPRRKLLRELLTAPTFPLGGTCRLAENAG